MRSLRAFGWVLVLGASVCAQFPYGGGSPGSGGLVPRIDCPPLISGSPSFGIAVSGATGGSTGVLGLSVAPGSLLIGSTPILIDISPGALFDLRPISLAGPLGVPGAGNAFEPFFVTFPPALLGADVYAQAVVTDAITGAPAATSGLRIELAVTPWVFVGTSVGGNTDPAWLVDPVAPAVVASFGGGFDNVSGGGFGVGNSRVYASMSLGAGIQEIDLSGFMPNPRRFWTANGVCYGIGVDQVRDLVYTLSDGPSGGAVRELIALDGNPGSGTYGFPIAQTTGLSSFGFVERMATSPSGRLTAVLTVFSPRLLIVDTDPTSPSFMTWTDLGPIPVSASSAFSVATAAAFTPDDSEVVIPIQLAGPVPGEVARYSFALGAWVDHDLGTARVDNIGLSSSPVGTVPSAPTGIAIARDGRSAVISGFGAGGSAVRLDLDASNPFAFQTTPLSGASGLAGAWALALVNDDTEAAIGSFGSGTPGLAFVNVASGLRRAFVPLPGASNVYTVVAP